MSSAQRNRRGSLDKSLEHARWRQTVRQWEHDDDIEDVQNISRVVGEEYAGKFKPPSAERAGRLRRLLDLLKPNWSSSGRWRYIVGVLVILLMAGGYLIGVRGLFDEKDSEVLPQDAPVEAPVIAKLARLVTRRRR